MHSTPAPFPITCVPPGPLHSRDRILELDGLRGVAILLVLVWHYVSIPLVAPTGSALAAIKDALVVCRSGVDLFFVLSGFLITGLLLDHRQRKGYFGVFYARRALRIMPLYYLLVVAFIAIRIGGATSVLFDGPIPLWSYLAFTQNYLMAELETYGAVWLGGTWSLAIEEQFYLVFPFLVRFCSGRFIWIVGLGLLGAPALRIASYLHSQTDWIAYVWMPSRLDSLCWGAALAYALRQPGWVSRLHKGKRTLLWVLVGWLLLGLPFLIRIHADIGFHFSIWAHTYLAILYAGLLLSSVLHRGEPGSSFLRWPALRALGKISYGVYLVHTTLLIAGFSIFRQQLPALRSGADIATALGCLCATVLLCGASYRWFEAPLLRWGRRLKHR